MQLTDDPNDDGSSGPGSGDFYFDLPGYTVHDPYQDSQGYVYPDRDGYIHGIVLRIVPVLVPRPAAATKRGDFHSRCGSAGSGS
jgi:hypothetical protein